MEHVLLSIITTVFGDSLFSVQMPSYKNSSYYSTPDSVLYAQPPNIKICYAIEAKNPKNDQMIRLSAAFGGHLNMNDFRWSDYVRK
jgi:hypothetical protein